MQVDIKFQKTEQTASLGFKLADFKDNLSKLECLAIITTFAADFYLDPELEVSDLEGFIAQATDLKKSVLTFILHEDGLELEFN